VSVISSIGYCAFLGGPPLIGLLAERDTVLHALTAVMVALVIASVITPAIRPLRPNRSFTKPSGGLWSS